MVAFPLTDHAYEKLPTGPQWVIVAPFGQNGPAFPLKSEIEHGGGRFTVTVLWHTTGGDPEASLIVTEYAVVAVGLTVMLAVVAPVFHTNE
jgi:hypothetical protein